MSGSKIAFFIHIYKGSAISRVLKIHVSPITSDPPAYALRKSETICKDHKHTHTHTCATCTLGFFEGDAILWASVWAREHLR